jgi:hypothetical protein
MMRRFDLWRLRRELRACQRYQREDIARALWNLDRIAELRRIIEALGG